jgi:hypothetical protein
VTTGVAFSRSVSNLRLTVGDHEISPGSRVGDHVIPRPAVT